MKQKIDKKGFVQIPLLIIIISIVVILVSAGMFFYKQGKLSFIANMFKSLEQNELNQAEQQIQKDNELEIDELKKLRIKAEIEKSKAEAERAKIEAQKLSKELEQIKEQELQKNIDEMFLTQCLADAEKDYKDVKLNIILGTSEAIKNGEEEIKKKWPCIPSSSFSRSQEIIACSQFLTDNSQYWYNWQKEKEEEYKIKYEEEKDDCFRRYPIK